MSQYAYSLNGENWIGAFDSRDAALAAAIQKCSGAVDRASTVFAAEIAGGEAFAAKLGKVVIDEMRSRARHRGGEGAGRYLRDVTPAQMNELDTLLEKAGVGWLQKHKLMPESLKVAAISEHPVPVPHRGLTRASHGNGQEVHDLGVGDESADVR